MCTPAAAYVASPYICMINLPNSTLSPAAHKVKRTTECLLLQAEATRSVQIQVSDLQEQLRSQKTMTDEAVEARREGEAFMAALSKTIRERDAQVASAKVSPHDG